MIKEAVETDLLDRVLITKKNKTSEQFNMDKVLVAAGKAATRAMHNLSNSEKQFIIQFVRDRVMHIASTGEDVTVETMHNIVEQALENTVTGGAVAKSYKDYRNYKREFAPILDEVYTESLNIRYRGDKENANSDSTLISTKRSLILNKLNKELYKKFFLTVAELQAIQDGYIYIHDMSSRLDSMNCCDADIKSIMRGGFEMGNMHYTEPKSLDVAFDVIGDIVLSAASQQYGGFTIPEVDKLLEPYAQKTYDRQLKKYLRLKIERKIAEKEAYCDVKREMEQGFQGWEYKFNTVASSRGDYPFISVSSGLSRTEFGKLANKTLLQVRAKGQGKKGFKKSVLFPKIIFLYDENIHGINKECEDIFDKAINCSSKAMYPDYLSMTGEGYVASIYKKYGRVISPMGCRAFLSPYYEEGGINPANEDDKPVFTGRFNIGVVSLHLPMIYMKAKKENRDFYEVLDEYLQMIRKIHQKTYEYLGELRAGNNPLMCCHGGFYGGNLNYNDKIKPLLKSATASFGVTALNELQQLHNQKSIAKDGQFALEVMEHINKKLADFKEEDNNLYAIYATPAESLAGLQIKQFRKKYGVIENVSDREYVSNSFHCHVSEDITPMKKQDLENRFWNLFNGGKIQYVKYSVNYNIKAIKTLIRRAMKLGLYEGVNFSLAYCDDCGHDFTGKQECPHCGSKNLVLIERVNGYLAYSRVHGDTRLNDAKMVEIGERVSM